MKRIPILLVSAGIVALALRGHADTVVSSPVGFNPTPLLGASDSAISIPFIRPPAFAGSVQSASGTTITVAGPSWTANRFVYTAGSQPNRYYVLIGASTSANPKEGHTYPIIGNGANSLKVDLGRDDLVGIAPGTQISVIPNWTLNTAFPAEDQDVSFTPTTAAPDYKTQVRVPDASTPGINPPFATYYFSENAWRLVGDPLTDRGDDPLLPDSYFVVRNLNGAPTLPLVTKGNLLLSKVTVPLMTNVRSEQDNPAGLLRPLSVTLNATGLNAADRSFVPGDQLLLFNNTEVGYDKAPSVYYLDPTLKANVWRLVGDTATDHGSDVIAPGTGFVIRKASTARAQIAYWTNSFVPFGPSNPVPLDVDAAERQ